MAREIWIIFQSDEWVIPQRTMLSLRHAIWAYHVVLGIYMTFSLNHLHLGPGFLAATTPKHLIF
jgi:hypothetical protein